MAITPDGGRALVANYAGRSVSVIDTATNTVTATVPVGWNPTVVAISPDGTRAYVTNLGDGTVSVVTIGQAISIVGTPPAGVVGQPYDYTFALVGQPSPTVTVTAGALPAGLVLGTDGTLSGIPTVSGQFEFTVTASNGIGEDAALPVTLAVADAPTAAGSLGSFGL